MVLEIAFIEVHPDQHEGIEQPNTYTFHINWESLEDHTVGFRESDLFVQWRSIIGGFFAKPPIVEHWRIV